MSYFPITGGEAKPGRASSTISFPYSDIDDAIAVAQGLLKGGGMSLSRDQLAAAMGQAPNGGGFNTKVSTARTFGVIEVAAGKYSLTDIGFEIADPSRQRAAMVVAFLKVELYSRVYEEFRGKRLPPRPHGLEAAFVNMGVAPKQATNARLAFDKSARKAGLFPNGDEERLVIPFNLNSEDNDQPPSDAIADGLVQSRSVSVIEPGHNTLLHAVSKDLHPSIVSWLEELPPPKSEWNKSEQVDWLQALAVMFRTIYRTEEPGKIVIGVSTPQGDRSS